LKLLGNLIIKSDTLGILTCALCIVHCFSTPFFIILSYNYLQTEHLTSVIWFKNLDYFFLVISFILVFFSSKTTSKSLMKFLFWLSWSLFFISIVNEKIELLMIPELMTYMTSILLAGIHLLNFKYCKPKKFRDKTI